jgi:hypothetical protein
MRKIDLMRFLVLLVCGIPLPMIAADDLPKPFSFARYQAMMDRSPFAVATAVVAPEAAPNFAKDLYIANAARSKEGDLVTIASSTDKNFKRYLTTGTTVDGFSITNIEWSDKVGATKVTITKENQVATLGFNEALLRQPGQNPGAPPVFQPPQQDKQEATKQDSKAAGQGAAASTLSVPPQNQTKPMPVPMLPNQPNQPNQPPRVRGVIPRNPTSEPPPKAGS